MLSAEDNQLLCRVEGDAPMGRLMREYWLPVCLSEEVAEADGAPLRLRILGEDLVCFRDSARRLGVLDNHCPHRKALLCLGRNEDGGLRCLYHGWKLDVDGHVLERPAEPAPATRTTRIKHRAYPVREAGGFVWAYLGPRPEPPIFEAPPFASTASTHVAIAKTVVACNWAQIVEGQIDSAHSSSLHASDMIAADVDRAGAEATHWTRPSTDKSPRLRVQLTSYGLRYAAIRRPIADDATHDYVRITAFVAPLTCLIPPNASYAVSQVTVPIDDHTSWFYFIASGDGPDVPSTVAWRTFLHLQPGLDVDAGWHRKRCAENNYLQDRQAMKQGSFTGIDGIPAQDIAMWEGMGAIADRTSERLGASDVAIVRWRRRMIDAARTHAAGGSPLGLAEPRVSQSQITAFEGIVPKVLDWRTLGTSEQERAAYPPAPVSPPPA